AEDRGRGPRERHERVAAVLRWRKYGIVAREQPPRILEMLGGERRAIGADEDERRVGFERVGHARAEVAALLDAQLTTEPRRALDEEWMRRIGGAPELQLCGPRLRGYAKRVSCQRRVQARRAFRAQQRHQARLHRAGDGRLGED